jgi:hypothetical protein
MIGDSVIQRLAASEVPCQAPLILGGRRSAAGGRRQCFSAGCAAVDAARLLTGFCPD